MRLRPRPLEGGHLPRLSSRRVHAGGRLPPVARHDGPGEDARLHGLPPRGLRRPQLPLPPRQGDCLFGVVCGFFLLLRGVVGIGRQGRRQGRERRPRGRSRGPKGPREGERRREGPRRVDWLLTKTKTPFVFALFRVCCTGDRRARAATSQKRFIVHLACESRISAINHTGWRLVVPTLSNSAQCAT